MMKYTSLLIIFGIISFCFREISNLNSSIQNTIKICNKLKEEVPSLNLNCKDLLRRHIEENKLNSKENNPRFDFSLLEIDQENKNQEENVSTDVNLKNIKRIENIENLINQINGNVKFISDEINDIKSTIDKKKTNFIKSNPEKKNDFIVTSESILREIEMLKKNKGFKEQEMDNTNKSEKFFGFKNDDNNNGSLLKIKSFNDLNLDLERLNHKELEKNKENEKKKNKDFEDINEIIESFKKKQASENISLSKKKFHKQSSINEKTEKLEHDVKNIMELLSEMKKNNQDIFSDVQKDKF